MCFSNKKLFFDYMNITKQHNIKEFLKSCILPPSSFSSALIEEEFGEDINAVVAADIFVIVSIC